MNNAIAVITDRKRPLFKQSQVFSGGGGALFGNILGGLSSLVNTFQAFVPEIVSTTEYYPFGMQMPGKSFNAGNYRYGFNGMEKDDEIKGVGNSINYIYRMVDVLLGRFFSVDLLASEYPHNSSYAFSENDLIRAVELEGLEKKIVITKGSGVTVFGGIPFAESEHTTTVKWSDIYPGQEYGPMGADGARHVYINMDNKSFVTDEYLGNSNVSLKVDNHGFPVWGEGNEAFGTGKLIDQPMDGPPVRPMSGGGKGSLVKTFLESFSNAISIISGFIDALGSDDTGAPVNRMDSNPAKNNTPDTLVCPVGCKIPMKGDYRDKIDDGIHAGERVGFDTIPGNSEEE